VSSAGSHSLVWDGTSDSGEMLGQGIYFVRMTTPEGMVTKKVNLIR
jgi:flagellar hook assembly protein FlgD